MKFQLTLNMPSFRNQVHQIVIDLPLDNCGGLCELLNEQDFILAEHYYVRTQENGPKELELRGNIVINTAHIGKATEYY